MTTVVRYRAAVVLLTAALLAALTFALTGGSRADALDGPVDVVYVATGQNFPDALAGSTLAVAGNAPLLTVAKDLPLPQATITALEALDPDRIVVFGGPAAVSDAVVGALTTFARTGSVTRISGTDRHATAAAIADALPAQVGDADHLDGLDSTAFLRSDATASDSARFGGFDHAATRSFPLSMPGALEGAARAVEGSASFETDKLGYTAWGFILPPDRTAGDPFEVDLAMDFLGHPCTARFQFAPIGLQQLVGFSPDGTNTYTIASSGTGDQRLTLRFSLPDDLGPGDVTRVGVLRQGAQASDTCGEVTLRGALVRY